jgi:uncharacterized SAM-binding protein YcdF (DUF218 family)
LLRVQILTGIGNFLIIQDPLEPSDIIFVLNGDVATRPFQVAKLVRQGLSDKVVIARAENSMAVEMGLAQNVTDTSVAVMEKAGIPESKIVQLPVPKGVTSTFDEATALRDYVRQNSYHRLIVVTSAIHTRRASWIIHKTFAGLPAKIMMSPAPDPRYTSGTWWRQEDGLIGCQNEYIKLVYYLAARGKNVPLHVTSIMF